MRGRHSWWYSATWERMTDRGYVGKHRAGRRRLAVEAMPTSEYVKATERMRARLLRRGA